MARTTIDDAAGLAAAGVIHERFTALPASATIGDVRKWFAASSHRRVTFLAEDGHYVGSLTLADLAGDLDAGRGASEVARRGATIAPDARLAPPTNWRCLVIRGACPSLPVMAG